MASVLIFNDRQVQAEIQEEAAGAAGHKIQLVVEHNVQAAVQSLQNHLASSVWDVLVLDIDIEHVDPFGGIWIYNRLAAGVGRARWQHTIIFTKWLNQNQKLAHATFGSHEFVLRVFADTAGIPFDNVLSNKMDTQPALVARIKELVPW